MVYMYSFELGVNPSGYYMNTPNTSNPLKLSKLSKHSKHFKRVKHFEPVGHFRNLKEIEFNALQCMGR